MIFFDRKKEISELQKIEQQTVNDSSRMVLLTGRRRIGKTVLAKRVFAESKMMYLFIARKSEAELVQTLTENIRSQGWYVPEGMKTFPHLIEYLFELGKTQTFTLILDEFQEFDNINRSVFSDMQNLWDSYKHITHINLVITGSVYSLIQKIFMDKDEPLFNRADHIIRLQPFTTSVLKEILTHYNADYTNEDLLALYTITGGVPKYVEWLIDNGCTTKDKMLEYVFSDNSHFIEEGRTLLVSEFGKNYGTYFSILQEIALGNRSQSLIEQRLGNISVGGYLKQLEETYQLINRERPIMSKRESKAVRFALNDNFIRFWFRYIEKNRSMIEIQNFEGLLLLAQKDYTTYTGLTLEQYFRTKMQESHEWREISSWWRPKAIEIDGRLIDAEIDIVALALEGKRAIVAEVKRKREQYDHQLFMAKVEYLHSTDLSKYKIETRLLTIEDM